MRHGYRSQQVMPNPMSTARHLLRRLTNSILSWTVTFLCPLTRGPIGQGEDVTFVYVKITEGKNVATITACGSGTSWSVQVSGEARSWECANTAGLLRICLTVFAVIALPVLRGIAGAAVVISTLGSLNAISALRVTIVIHVPTTLARRSGTHL